MYHGVGGTGSVISTPVELFARQMDWLAHARVRVVSLSEVVAWLVDGRELPVPAVALTFDDGLESVYRHAWPILSAHGFPATVFVVTGYCGRDNGWSGQPAAAPREPMLAWSQVAELARGGVEIASHTADHPRLDLLPAEEVAFQLAESQRAIAERLGQAPALFAYPYGRHTAAVREIAGRYYRGAFTARPGLAAPGHDPLQLDRIDAAYVAHPFVFARLSSPLFDPYLRLRRILRSGASRVLKRAWA
jgi:peptidoglycan/xylan/chitin deacetylase (PgdA/CDA1 family)